MRFPSINEIEMQWKGSVSQFCIVIEGETGQDDTWFYNQWFGDRAREVEFFPQNGWKRVTDAVAQLRGLLGKSCVYGIVDRDFREKQSYNTVPTDGILQTPRYTLENYLLNPECWYEIVRPFTRRSPKPGWNSTAEVTNTIRNFYKACIPLAAHNSTFAYIQQLDAHVSRANSESRKNYKEHPKALETLGALPEYFGSLQAEQGLSIDLGQSYEEFLTKYNQIASTELEQFVSGKYVLKLLHEEFPLGSLTKASWSDMLGAYIDVCPEPPDDLAMLIDLIANTNNPQ